MTREAEVGLAAAVGGIAPSVIALAVELVTNDKAEIPTRPGYYVGLTLFAVIGYFVARAWNEKVPKTAFFLGVGLPAMFQVGTAAIHKPGSPQIIKPATVISAPNHTWRTFFSNAAYAEGTDPTPPLAIPTPNQNEHSLQLIFSSIPSDTHLVFESSSGRPETVTVNWAEASRKGGALVRVPPGAATVKFVSALTRNSPVVSLRDIPLQVFRLQTESDALSGFLQALGFKATDVLNVAAQAPPPPNQARTLGIDISSLDTVPVNWKAFSDEHIAFAFIRASQGAQRADPAFIRNMTQCRDASLVCGAYHVLSSGDPEKQAAFFWSQAGALNGVMLALVVERPMLASADMPAATSAFIGALRKYTNRPIIIYLAQSDVALFANSPALSVNPLWVGSFRTKQPDGSTLKPWDKWTFWQFSSGAETRSLSRSYFAGSIDQLRALAS